MSEDFDNLKKVIEAAKDISKINETIRSNYNLQTRANSVYNSVNYKIDYADFIRFRKKIQHMCGTRSFESLRIEEKKAVLEMIREAIKDYVLSVAKEELQKQYPYSEILTEICKILKCTIEELKEME